MSDQRDDRLDLLSRVLGVGYGQVDRTAIWAIHGQHATVPRVPVGDRAMVAAKPSSQGYLVTGDGVAVIDVAGPLSKWASIWRLFGFSDQPTLGELTDLVRDAHQSRSVTGIMLRIDSPGGTAWGTSELADAVHAARADKPVHAYALDQACSAAYWIGSQASRLTSNAIADVGSIGVYMLLVDSAKMAQDLGLKFIRLRTGEHKGVGVPGVEITEAEQQELQRGVDAIHQLFLSAITRGRPALAGEELQKLADGRCFVGEEAAQLGLTDGVETFDAAMDHLRAAVRANTAGNGKGNAMAQETTPAPAGAGSTSTDSAELEQLRAELAAAKEAKAAAEAEAAVATDLAALSAKVPPAVRGKPETKALLVQLKKAGDQAAYQSALDLVAGCDASHLFAGPRAAEDPAAHGKFPGLTAADVHALKSAGMEESEILRVLNTHGLN